jgi:hypothetical protein
LLLQLSLALSARICSRQRRTCSCFFIAFHRRPNIVELSICWSVETTDFIEQKGCAILYSTHQRNTADLLRGRHAGNGDSLNLSKPFHKWVSIPRLHMEMCLRGLEKDPSEQPTFWCAVLRGRLPSLAFLDAEDIRSYAHGVLGNVSNLEPERQSCLAAVITGKIDHQLNERNCSKLILT